MSNISILRLISSVSFRRSINSRVWSPCTCVQNFAHLMEAAQTKLVSVKSNNSTVLPQLNDKLISHKKSVYTLTYLIGEGGYGTVFQCTDGNNNKYALKVEKWDKTVLKIELYVLTALAEKNCKHFCKIRDWGERTNEYFFLVMTLLGTDLSRLRACCSGQHFSLGTALRVGMQTMNALQELHSCRFISRDVKPSNFAPGLNSQRRMIFMFDFGLARKYMDRFLTLYPARPNVGFRGTIRYGSLAAHLRQDLGRKADVESWLYMVVEFTKGSLPWRRVNDREKVQEMKSTARTTGRAAFLSGCPPCFDQMLTLIDALAFESVPPYAQLIEILNQCCTDNSITMDQRYDWEEQEPSSTEQSTSKVDSDEKIQPNVKSTPREMHPQVGV